MQKKIKNKEENSDTHRVAKVIARSGFCSRREAERLIKNGRVKVNEKIITSPALNIKKDSEISIDDQPITKWERTRLWLYHKPIGLLTTNSDPEGRPTIFDHLPADLPRLMSVGRLDLNSEGLLLLTNDGDLSRYLELPKTGWSRKYRVRIFGKIQERHLDELRKGISLKGINYSPMGITLDSQGKTNSWLTVILKGGKNREIRETFGSFGLRVNRLIRVAYGPLNLGRLGKDEIVEVDSDILQKQILKEWSLSRMA